MLYLVKKKDIFHGDAYEVFSEKGNYLGYIYTTDNEKWPYNVSLNLNYANQRFATLIEAKKYIIDTFKHHNEPVSEANTKNNIKFLPCDEESLKNFFPTPESVIGKMFGKVDWKGVSSVLEPSAGKGDIVDCLIKTTDRTRWDRGCRIRDIDCIELDPNLRAILKGKEHRVVGDDFLSFNTHKRYDLIIMNPPFDNGAAHLLKAIQMQKDGGQIVCLLNGETLKNPYTVQRRVLLQTLLKYNASVDYVRNAFSKAERKTNVEVAIVSIKIPKQEIASEIFERMQKAATVNAEIETSRELASTDFITNLISEYNVEVGAGIEFIKQYFGMIPYMRLTKPKEEDNENNQSPFWSKLISGPIITIKIGDHDYSDINEAINAFVKFVRRKYWRFALESKAFSENMTTDMKKAYQDRIKEMEDYEISRFNLEAVLSDILKNVVSGVSDSIMKLFEKLSVEHSYFPECANNVHYYNGWCSNKAHKVNMKCIVPTHGIVADYSWSKCFEVRTAYELLSDLEKSLNYLSGQSPTSFIDLETLLQVACNRGQKTKISCKYFEVSFYKKGTTHIKFYDKELVDKLNIFAAQNKNWLPPRYGKVKYEDLNDDERTVVDEFQTREEYQRVYDNPSKLLFTPSAPSQLLLGA